LDKLEVKQLSEDLGIPMTKNELNAMFLEYDVNNDDKISIDEFKCWWGVNKDAEEGHKL